MGKFTLRLHDGSLSVTVAWRAALPEMALNTVVCWDSQCPIPCATLTRLEPPSQSGRIKAVSFPVLLSSVLTCLSAVNIAPSPSLQCTGDALNKDQVNRIYTGSCMRVYIMSYLARSYDVLNSSLYLSEASTQGLVKTQNLKSRCLNGGPFLSQEEWIFSKFLTLVPLNEI